MNDGHKYSVWIITIDFVSGLEHLLLMVQMFWLTTAKLSDKPRTTYQQITSKNKLVTVYMIYMIIMIMK